MVYTVEFSPEANAHLADIYYYIALAASADIAERFMDGILLYCASLSTFPQRGVKRDDILPGLRITNFRKRVSIAFRVKGNIVYILGIYYGGRNYEAALRGNLESD